MIRRLFSTIVRCYDGVFLTLISYLNQCVITFIFRYKICRSDLEQIFQASCCVKVYLFRVLTLDECSS